MSSTKEQHYWLQLRAALTGGQWRTTHPAKAYNGVLLPWSELFRKFNKHCRGYKEVAEVAEQTRVLASLLSTDIDDEDVVGNETRPPVGVGNECILGRGQPEEVLARYDVLKSLKLSNANSLHFALAYYAYALDKPGECLEHLSRVSDIPLIQNHIPTQAPMHSNAGSLLTPASRTEASVLSITATFSTVHVTPVPEVRDGRGWAMTETFRSICLQGMSYERFKPSEPQQALRAYVSAIPLFAILTSEFTLSSTTQSTGKLDFTPFLQLREMWRWVERLLWRAIVLSSRMCDVHHDDTSSQSESLWQWFGHYTTCSTTWPSSFRTAHRSTVSTLYLRAFTLRYRILSGSPVYMPRSPRWLSQARSLAQDYRAILSSCTKFPHAEERNVKVEEFVDLCVAVWEASGGVGEHAGWVIDILWWATRYTFNSPRIYRHMTRLFHLAGDTALAKRTLKLYVQIVGKAWLAKKEGVKEDVDLDDLWVETLIFGIRMLCRFAAASADPESIDDVRYAGTLIEKARSRLNKERKVLVASIFLAEGIWNSVMALKEEDPYTRPQRLEEAHNCFTRSIEVQPTSSGYYHLALSFARAGPSQDLRKAVESAGSALEGDPKEIRYWHLLGLLLTTQERWKEAAEILERGAGLDEEISEELGDEEGGVGEEAEVKDTIAVESKASVVDGDRSGSPTSSCSEPTPAPKPAYVLGESETGAPLASELLGSMLEKSLPSRRDLYEYGLQLRMTQAALTEVVKGPEGAELKWIEVFSWIAEKKGVMHSPEASHRLSMESSAPLSMTGHKTFVMTHESTAGNTTGVIPSPDQEQYDQLVAPIPITISPATPEPGKLYHDVPHSPEDILSEKEWEKDKEKPKINGLRVKRSISIDQGDTSKSKKVQQMLKDRVHKGRAGISAVSRKIGHGVSKHHHLNLRRTNSSPNFHEVIRNASYQASSIHSRRRLGSFIQFNDRTPTGSPPPPPPPPPVQPPASQQELKPTSRQARENRLLSNLWLMSAATFRRLGKIEQAKGAIQEAEVRDEGNPAVWVQLGLCYFALGHHQHAIDALQKALFISTDDVAATIHLSRLYLTPVPSKSTQKTMPTSPVASAGDTSPTFTLNSNSTSLMTSIGRKDEPDPSNVDLAAGLLVHLTRGKGWDVPEAWYFLAKAYGLQQRKEREREALKTALKVSEGRGVRDIQSALGWCI